MDLWIWFKMHSVFEFWGAKPTTHSQEPVELHNELFTAISHCTVWLQVSSIVSKTQVSKLAVTLYPSEQEQLPLLHSELVTASEHCWFLQQESSIFLKIHSVSLLDA